MSLKSIIRYPIVPALILFGLLLTACSDTSGPDTDASSAVPLGRLPANTQPLHYRLHLSIDPRQERFAGETLIDIQLAEASDTIWLHGNRLDVSLLSATLPDGEIVEGSYQQVADIGVARLDFPRELPAGRATLAFQYSAPFNTNLEGLYKVSTGGEDYAFTQFQATSARLAFPGFDEPGFKVPFDITVDVDAAHKAVSSSPVAEKSILDNGNKRLRYETTQPLPTYLIAFAVGPLDERVGDPIPATELRESPLPFYAYSVKGQGEQLQFALDNTADIVIAQEDYFGTPYPYDKLAVIAVPDFGAGAMENVGAITYREQYLLQSEDTPIELRQRFLSVHAHELAHQWFGNLVTPVWWTDIWLNESFATWMASKTMHSLQPEAGYDQRMLDSALSTMKMDQLVSARQIRQPVESHAEIGAAFDGITYQKGGAVLAMLEGFVGEDAFKQGIQAHMQRHSHGNADARDFVQAIASSRPDLPEGQVEAAFFSFLEQAGIPLVELDWDCQDQGPVTVSVRQSRYLPLGSSGDPDQSWVLPLCIAYGEDGKQQHCELIEAAQARIAIPAQTCPDYIMPNANGSGYYRWSLSEEQWRTLLYSWALNPREQLTAADSLSAAYHSGQFGTVEYFDLLPPLLNSTSTQVITTPLSDIRLIGNRMLGPDLRPYYQDRVRELYQSVYDRVSLDKSLDDGDAIRLRTSMLELFALFIEEEGLRQQLHLQAIRYVGFGDDRELHPEAMDSNIREVALATAVNLEGREFAELLLDHFHQSESAVLREEILRALAYSNDPEFRAELRALALSDAVRGNETEHIIEPLMNRLESEDETWDWLRDNLDAVVERRPSWSQGRVIEYAAGFCSEERYQEVAALGEEIRKLQRGPRSLANTIEQIQLCQALVDEQGPK